MGDCKLPTSEELERAILAMKKKPYSPFAHGGQGEVYKLTGPNGSCFFAAKTSKSNDRTDESFVENQKALVMESKVLEFLRKDCQSYLLCFVGSVTVDGKFWLVTEYLDGIELFQAIYDGKPPTKEALQNLVRGLKVLHKNNIAHMDIKPENIIYNPTTESSKTN